MPSKTDWQKLPQAWTNPCSCGERALYRAREIFTSGKVSEWLYFCDAHAIEYNRHNELPEMRQALPTYEQAQKELIEQQERELEETDEPKTDVDKVLDIHKRGEPTIPEYDDF